MQDSGSKKGGEDENASGDEQQEFDIGYNEAFERRWWRIEVGLWIFLTAILIAGLGGLMGSGKIARKEIGSSDGAVTLKYERIARFKTPSTVLVRLAPQTFHNSVAYVWLNRAFTEDLVSSG